MKKDRIGTMTLLLIILFLLSGCTFREPKTSSGKEADTISVVTTVFPPYDFAKEIGGERVEVHMLLSPGMESHSYEPTPQDIMMINDSDLFLYVGGESDAWVRTILNSLDNDSLHTVTLMDCVETIEEETVEGMETKNAEAKGHEAEYDEHVWTSPRNAVLITDKISEALCEVDAAHRVYYEEKTTTYQDKLRKLDEAYRTMASHAARSELIFGDRFPFLYLAKAYGLTYYAAFPGCSAQTEPSAKTIAFLTDKVRKDQIPVILYLELSNHQIADAIAETTGVKTAMLHSCHNISQDEVEAGVTYLSLMEQNLEVLKGALQ